MGICLVMGLLCHGMVPSSIFRVCRFRLSGLGARGFVMGFSGGVVVSLVWS